MNDSTIAELLAQLENSQMRSAAAQAIHDLLDIAYTEGSAVLITVLESDYGYTYRVSALNIDELMVIDVLDTVQERLHKKERAELAVAKHRGEVH